MWQKYPWVLRQKKKKAGVLGKALIDSDNLVVQALTGYQLIRVWLIKTSTENMDKGNRDTFLHLRDPTWAAFLLL